MAKPEEMKFVPKMELHEDVVKANSVNNLKLKPPHLRGLFFCPKKLPLFLPLSVVKKKSP